MDPAPRCLQVDVDADDADVVSGMLWEGGVSGIHELDLGGGRTRLVAGFDPEVEAALVARLGVRWVPDVFDADHDGWLDAWRPFARPVRAGRVVVHPPWEPPPWADVQVEPDDLIVPIDPGRAFGQGNHPTTRLVLDHLQRLVGAGDAVLDVGCGSGVLAVVAARLGAGRVRAVDIDAAAVRATRENAARNGVEARVVASLGSIADLGPDPPREYDLVVANVLAPVLVDLAPAMERCVGETGRLVLSGMLEAQLGRVEAALPSSLVAVERTALDGWVAAVHRRR